MIKNLLELLQKPFPEMEGRFGLLKLIALISLFVTFFLYVFQPFGIADLGEDKLWICLGFGSMTFIACLIYELTITPLLHLLGVRKNWTFAKWLVNNLGLLFIISLANFLFIRISFFGYIQWELFPTMLYGNFMIGIIPFTVWGAYSLIRKERKYQGIASEINKTQSFTQQKDASTPQVIFSISSEHIRYVEALQNYVKIGYLNKEGEWKEQVERFTLKQVLKEAEGSNIVKCHRSYLVNKEYIIQTTGNAQGLLLSLSKCPKEIPVSRSFVAHFR